MPSLNFNTNLKFIISFTRVPSLNFVKLNDIGIVLLKIDFMKSIDVIILLILLNIINGCDCENCQQNLASYYNKIGYKNNEIVQFSNSQGNIKLDTVQINYTPVPKQICSSTDHQQDCWGDFEFIIGNYVISGNQGPNLRYNATYCDFYFKDQKYYNDRKIFICDTIDYEYRGNSIIALHYIWNDTIKEDNSIKHYTEFIISKNDYRLLKFCINENNFNECWNLK